MITADIIHSSLLDEFPYLRLFQMFNLVMIRGCQISAHASLMAGDDDPTTARGMVVVDSIFHPQPGLADRVLKDVGIFVTTDTANIQN